MGRKKKEETVEVVSHEPLRKCYDCIHWHMCKDGNNNDNTGNVEKLLNDIVWSHSNRPYNNLSNPSYAEVAFFIDV